MRLLDKTKHPKLKILKNTLIKKLLEWIQMKDYKYIYHFIIKSNENDDNLYELFINLLSIKNKSILIKQFQKIKRHLNTKINKKYILLNKVFALIEEYFIKANNNTNNKKKDRTFYIQVKPEDIIMYKEEYNYVNGYQVLKFACIFKINDYKFFPLFALQRNELSYEEIKYLYNNEWLFHASYSPIWEERLEIFNVDIEAFRPPWFFKAEKEL
jgi:hypothetical protein